MKTVKKLLYSFIDRTFLGGCSNYNSLATRKSCRSKKQARQVFKNHDIPHAQGTVFYGLFKPLRFAARHGFPLVIKPNVSGFSRGSHFPITGYGGLLKAAVMVKIWWPASIIEQYLQGRNYRIVVLGDEIMSAIRRYPPFVQGDGCSTIAQLIDRENKIRQSMNLHPVIHPLATNSATVRFLKKKKMGLSSIPADGETVTLHNRISLAPGGVVEVIDKDSIHPKNRELLEKIPQLFNANILGIDAIFEQGIEIPHDQQRVFFLEVNSRPYLKMHGFPRYGKKENLQPYFDRLKKLEIAEGDTF